MLTENSMARSSTASSARIAAMTKTDVLASAIEWRRDFHRHPELLFNLERTSGRVADLLRSFGCDEVATGIGEAGVVAVLKGDQRSGSLTIGIRADMDALPIAEKTGLEFASTVPGRMHACGHDGHTAMLLAAVKLLAEKRDFPGVFVAIFQPAEEGGGGAKIMIDEGLFDRFKIDEIYALHNIPGLRIGSFALSSNVMMAASDRFDLKVVGTGGHAARPHETVDPIVIANQIINAFQTIVSRSADPLDPMVVSVTSIHAGEAYNVIPSEVSLKGSVRTLSDKNRELGEGRIRSIASSIASGYGAEIELMYHRGYPSTVNHAEQAMVLADVAASVVGEALVDRATPALMASEDFSYMLQERPGAFIFLGNGPSHGLHHPKYNFDENALAYGIDLWVELVRKVRSG